MARPRGAAHPGAARRAAGVDPRGGHVARAVAQAAGARLSLPHATPRRVVMVAPTAGRLIESDLVMNLATPSKIGDAAWVRPGITAWDHWWHGGVPTDTATLKQYVRLAAEMARRYQLVDGQWYGPYI